MNSDVASSLAASNKRIGNILRKSETALSGNIDEDVLVIDEEQHLFAEIKGISQKLADLYKDGNYAAALELLAGLSGSIEAFFEQVMVMDEDPVVRNNRLNLLAELKGMFDRVANLAMVS